MKRILLIILVMASFLVAENAVYKFDIREDVKYSFREHDGIRYLDMEITRYPNDSMVFCNYYGLYDSTKVKTIEIYTVQISSIIEHTFKTYYLEEKSEWKELKK